MKKLIIFDFYKTIYNPDSGKLFYGIRKTLRRLMDSNDNFLVLITTNSNDRLNQINRLKIKPFFNEVIICTKKTPEIFEETINKYSTMLRKIKTVVIGDRLEEEIKIGRKLKTMIVCVKNVANPNLLISQRLFS